MVRYSLFFFVLISFSALSQIELERGENMFSFFTKKKLKKGIYKINNFDKNDDYLTFSLKKYKGEPPLMNSLYDTISYWSPRDVKLVNYLGVIKAKGECAPWLIADKIADYNLDTLLIEGEQGNLIPVPTKRKFSKDGVYNGNYSIVKNGQWVYFDSSIELGRCTYQNGMPINGKDVEFFNYSNRIERTYENQKVIKVDAFNGDKLEGKVVLLDNGKTYKTDFFNSNGELIKRFYTSNGKLDSSYFELNCETLDTIESGEFVNNQKQGIWKKWFPLNEVKKPIISIISKYQSGQLIEKSLFDTSGNKLSVFEYKIVLQSNLKDLNQDFGYYHLIKDSVSFGLQKATLYYRGGKLQQETFYNSNYRIKFNYGVLDGVYIANTCRIKVGYYLDKTPHDDPEFEYPCIKQLNYDTLGTVSTLHFKKGRPYSGQLVQYFDNGKIQKRAFYKRGKKEGQYLNVKANGDTIEFKESKFGMDHGYVISHYFHGNKLLGKNHGKIWYGKYGNVSSRHTAILREKYGPCEMFHGNGKLKSRGFEIDWGKDGRWEFFDTLGRFMHKKMYIKNEELGVQNRRVPIFTNHYDSEDCRYYSGNFIPTTFASGVFGWTVPQGDFFIKSEKDKDTLSYTYFNKNKWDSLKPNIPFKKLHRKLFLPKCDFYEPIKFGEEILFEKGIARKVYHHRHFQDSIFYYWRNNANGDIEESYKIKLAKDFRLLKKNSFGELTLYSGRGEHDTINNYITNHGLFSIYYPNGKLKRNYYKSQFNAYQIGPSQSFYSNGVKKFEGMFIDDSGQDGVAIGHHEYFNEQGELRKTIDFEKNNYIIKCFDSNNNILYEQEFLPAKQGRYFFTQKRNTITRELGTSHIGHGYKKTYKDGIIEDILFYDFGILIEGEEKELNVKWKSLEGPKGCDATSFYVDYSGKYWLGTGSSGGVFTSINQGMSWNPLNKGIGPVHVELMGVVNDTMFIVKSTPDKKKELFQFNGNQWISQGSDLKMFQIEDSLLRMKHHRADTSYISYKDWTNQQWNPYEFYWFQSGKDNYYYDSKRLYPTVSFVDGKSPLLFEQPSGNSWKLNDSTSIFFGKNGLFNYNRKTINENNYKGIIASDIKEVLEDKNGVIWAIVGLGDVWNLKGKKWSQVFDAHEEWLKDTTQVFLYNTNNLEEVAGEIRFACLGKVFTVKNGKAKVLIKEPDSLIVFSYSAVSNNEFAMIMKNDSVKQGERLRYFIRYHKNGKDSLFSYKIHRGNCVLKKSSTGVLWAFSPNEIINISEGKRYSLIRDFNSGVITENHITFKENGDFAFMQSDEEILTYENGEFKTLFIQQLKGVTAISYYKGVLFGGTGFDFAPSCALVTYGTAHGLYKLENNITWTRIKDCPNPWIMSLFPTKRGLLVGTSGSGLWVIK